MDVLFPDFAPDEWPHRLTTEKESIDRPLFFHSYLSVVYEVGLSSFVSLRF